METSALSTLADLLKEPSKSSNYPTSCEPGHDSSTTILDLGSRDRYRVLQLIEELLDTQEEVDKLKQKLDGEKSEFREKRSTLLKKIDALNEKHEKALNDIHILKERHSHSLNKLEQKISTVSNKFEASVAEIIELRKANAELRRENMALRKLNSESTSTVAIIQEENSRLSTKLEVSKQKEKAIKKELKKLKSEITVIPESKNSRSSSALQGKSLQEQQTNEKEPMRHYAGAGAGDCGDFSTNHPYFPSSSGFIVNTIKAPTNTGFQQSNLSTLAFPNSYRMDSFPLSPQKHLEVGSSLEDATILENLFFRF